MIYPGNFFSFSPSKGIYVYIFFKKKYGIYIYIDLSWLISYCGVHFFGTSYCVLASFTQSILKLYTLRYWLLIYLLFFFALIIICSRVLEEEDESLSYILSFIMWISKWLATKTMDLYAASYKLKKNNKQKNISQIYKNY
jgi:hypothetical protein